MGSSVVRGHGSVVRQNGTWSASIQKSRAARSSLSPLQLRAFVSSSSPIPATRTCSDPALCRLGGFTQTRTKHPVDVSRRATDLARRGWLQSRAESFFFLLIKVHRQQETTLKTSVVIDGVRIGRILSSQAHVAPVQLDLRLPVCS